MKGSMTVEAVFVMSIILLVILWIMRTAILMYQQTVEGAMLEGLAIETAADTFRRIFFVKERLP